MCNKRLLFFDIDGTLITDDGRRIIPDSTRRAIKLAREKGCLTFINTGRVFCNIEEFIRSVGFDGYVCGCGSYIRLGDEVLYHRQLPQDICREIAYACRRYGITSIFEHSDVTCYDREMDSSFRDRIVNYFAETTDRLIDDIEDKDFIFDKFSGWYTDESDLAGFKAYIEPYFDYIDREGPFCEMAPKGHSKATGIKYLLDYLDIPLHNAYVFGDGNNDLPMLEYVDRSVCMGGGSELARQAAEYVTDTVLGDGIEKAMRYYKLI